MNMNTFCNSAFRSTLIVASLTAAFGFGTTATAFAEESAPQAHSDGLGAVISDTAITAKVKAKLMGEKHLKKSDITVTTTNGVVTLNGSASSSKSKTLAETETKSIDGVKSVDNNLVTPSGSKATAETKKAVAQTERVVSDSWITTKVKSEILANSLTKGLNVSVKTIHGVVVLTGTLANHDAVDHVKGIAAKVDGVKSVDISALTVTGK